MARDERSDLEIAALFGALVMGGTLASEAPPESRMGRLRAADAGVAAGFVSHEERDAVLAAIRAEIVADMSAADGLES